MTDSAMIEGLAAGARTAPQRQRPLAWTSTVLATAALTLLALNARALPSWLDGLPPSATTLTLHEVASAWAATSAQWGLGRPREAVRTLWRARRPDSVKAQTDRAAR